MKYLDKSFSALMPGTSAMACERCVFGSGKHAPWCDSIMACLERIDALLAEEDTFPLPVVERRECE